MDIRVASREDEDRIRELFVEYLRWVEDENDRRWGFRLDDFEAYIDETIAGLDRFMPPDGLFLLAMDGEQIAGSAALKRLGDGIGEINRMYVRPAYRRQGLARAMLGQVIEHADVLGYHILRLDSTQYMTGAHALYRSMGFQDRGPYPETDVPAELHRYWVFMERVAEEG